MAKMLAFVVAIPICLGLIWGVRWMGVPQPWDSTLVMFVALVVLAFEQRRASRARFGK